MPTDRSPSKTFVPPSFSSTPLALDKHRVAVLPLHNISQDPQDEYFADGMTEELISTISMVGDLQVISRTSVMQYKGGSKKTAEIGRELNAGTLLEGSVRRAGSRLRISVQLIDVQEDKHLWAQKYDRELTDVFAIQSEIAERVAGGLKVQLLPLERERVERIPTGNTEAFELYLKGRYFWNQRTKESLKKALGYFEKAIEKDPGYARAYLGLAECYSVLGEHSHLSGNEAFPKSKALAAKALELDESLFEAHAVLGVVLKYEWDWAGSERELRLAIELSPSYASAHQWYGLYLGFVGRHEEARAETRKAQELDPLSPIIDTNIAYTYFWERRYDEAINQYRRVLETHPNFVIARCWLGWTYSFKSMFDEAMAEIQKAKALSPEDFLLNGVLAYVYAVSGRREDARKVVDELLERSRDEYVSPLFIAWAYIGLGDKDRAFEWLEKAYEDRSGRLRDLKVHPVYETLRSDPRFVILLEKIGLA